MGAFEKYLIAVNILGFLVYFINFLLYRFTESSNVDALLTVVSLAGGSLGIFVFVVLFDRKSVKENMMSRVFLLCVLIIQIVIVLYLNGVHGEQLTLAFWDFFGKYKILVAYLVVINFVSFAAFAIDKINAIEGRSRVRIITLLGLAFIGGSVGALLGMYILRHKTRIDYFTVGIPLIMIMQVVVLFFLMNL